VVPLAFANAAIEHDDTAKEREQERERAVRHLLHAIVRHVAHPDAAGRGRVQVDVVIADGARGNDLEGR
jgi:hypothetical protein